MTSRSFRRLFPQLNVQSIPEDEFYRQASLSQLLTGPDEQELASFRPDVKDPLELVEATPELAGMLGSSLEFVDTRWDSLEASPPPTPSQLPSQRLTQRLAQRIPPSSPPQRQRAEAGAKMNNVLHSRTAAESGQCRGLKNPGYSANMETKMDSSMWEPRQLGSKNASVPAKPNVTMNANMWELQRQKNENTWISNSVNPDSKMNCNMWEQPQQGDKSTGNTPVKSNAALGSNMWEPQRLRSRSAMNPDAKVDAATPEPQRIRNKNTANSANSNGTVDANMWKRLNRGSKTGGVSDSTNPAASVDGSVWEPQRLRSKNAGTTSPTVDADMWERQGIKRVGGPSSAPKRESCDNQDQDGKSIKMDAAWQRNLGNVRVHIRDLGMKVGGGTLRRDAKKEQGKSAGKGARVKTRS